MGTAGMSRRAIQGSEAELAGPRGYLFAGARERECFSLCLLRRTLHRCLGFWALCQKRIVPGGMSALLDQGQRTWMRVVN